MIRRPPRSTLSSSSAASDVYKRQISSIADYLLSKFNKEFDTRTRPLSAVLQRQLRAYSWPGNMWELQTVVRRYALLGTTTSILKSLGSPLEDSPRTFG